MKFNEIAIWVIMITIATIPTAEAYIDPGSGALLWQLIVAVGVGILYYFRRIKNWILDKLFNKG